MLIIKFDPKKKLTMVKMGFSCKFYGFTFYSHSHPFVWCQFLNEL